MLRDLIHDAIKLEEDRQSGNDNRSRAEIAEDLSSEYITYIVDRFIGA